MKVAASTGCEILKDAGVDRPRPWARRTAVADHRCRGTDPAAAIAAAGADYDGQIDVAVADLAVDVR